MLKTFTINIADNGFILNIDNPEMKPFDVVKDFVSQVKNMNKDDVLDDIYKQQEGIAPSNEEANKTLVFLAKKDIIQYLEKNL